MQLKIQKLDRRMTGHRWYKYRVEFPISAFRDSIPSDISVYQLRTQTFTELMYHLTRNIGFGPYVDYSGFSHDPKWAFRIADHNHLDTVYLTEEAKLEYERFMTFIKIKYSG